MVAGDWTNLWVWGVLIYGVLVGIPSWRIITKAGYSGAWTLIIFVPVLNLVFYWVFAFSEWPAVRAARLTRPSGATQ